MEVPRWRKVSFEKYRKLVKKSSKRQLSEVAAQPILTPQKKVTTPKLVKAVLQVYLNALPAWSLSLRVFYLLQAVTPDSKASQFLRRGSRSPNPQPTEHSQPPMEGRASSAPDELLLRPDQLSEEANKRPKLSRTRMLCPSFSNRINPTNDDLTPRAHSDWNYRVTVTLIVQDFMDDESWLNVLLFQVLGWFPMEVSLPIGIFHHRYYSCAPISILKLTNSTAKWSWMNDHLKISCCLDTYLIWWPGMYCETLSTTWLVVNLSWFLFYCGDD